MNNLLYLLLFYTEMQQLFNYIIMLWLLGIVIADNDVNLLDIHIIITHYIVRCKQMSSLWTELSPFPIVIFFFLQKHTTITIWNYFNC